MEGYFRSVVLIACLGLARGSGAQSYYQSVDQWSASLSRLPASEWTVQLSVRDFFPMIVYRADQKLCFQDDQFLRVNYEDVEVDRSSTRCCFVTDNSALKASEKEVFNFYEIILEPRGTKKHRGREYAHFGVRHPEKIFLEFSCSAVRRESGGGVRPPSLAEINSALSLSFGMTSHGI